MNPTRLRLRNVRRFADLDIDLPTGTVALIGGNGAGKSSLLNAIDIALFAERGELTDLITTGEDRLELELMFEHAGDVYRVRRQAKRGKSPTVDFECCQAGGDHVGEPVWEPLTRENAAATQQLICETVGLTRKTFRASSFLKQGDTAAFTEADPASRKALLAEILRLGLWDDSDGRKPATSASLLGLARADLRQAEEQLNTTAYRLDAIAEQLLGLEGTKSALADYREKLQRAADELAVAERALEKASEAKASNAAAAERLRGARAELTAAEQQHSRISAELAAAEAAEQRRGELQRNLNTAAELADTAPALEQQLEQHRARAARLAERGQALRTVEQRELAHRRMVDQAQTIRGQVTEARAKAERLLADVEHAGECDRCGQTLGAEAAQRAAASYRAEADRLLEQAAEISQAADRDAEQIAELRAAVDAIEIPDVAGDQVELQAGLDAARAAGEQRARFAEQLRQAAETAARRPTLAKAAALTDANVRAARAAVEAARADVADETELDAAVANAQRERARIRAEHDDANAVVVRTEQLLEQLKAAAAERDTLVGERARVQQRVERLRQAVAAYGRNGIPALIVEAVAVPQIEQEANRLLQLMPTVDGTTLQVQLRTQRELKGGDGELRDALEIVIFDGDAERLYDSYSGGEKGRVNLCLRIALARLLAHRRGAESRLLAIDELPYMDTLAQDQLVDVVKAVAGDFDRTIVVGHSETFQQSFDQTIRVVKRGGRSAVDEPAVAVLA